MPEIGYTSEEYNIVNSTRYVKSQIQARHLHGVVLVPLQERAATTKPDTCPEVYISKCILGYITLLICPLVNLNLYIYDNVVEY